MREQLDLQFGASDFFCAFLVFVVFMLISFKHESISLLGRSSTPATAPLQSLNFTAEAFRHAGLTNVYMKKIIYRSIRRYQDLRAENGRSGREDMHL